MRNSVDGVKNRFFPSPKYVSDGDEVCDGLIICGSSVALLEYKGSTFTAQAKYGAAPQVLVKEIEEKLVESRKGERKGVLQLSNAVVRLFGRGSSDSISGVDLSGVQTIYPVLVTRDDLGGALVINAFLNRRFRNVLNPKMVRPRTVTPLFCLSSEALEVISGYLGEARFTDILEARYRSEPTLMSTFLAVDNAVINKIGKRRNKDLDAAFDEFRSGVALRLFPNETFPANEGD